MTIYLYKKIHNNTGLQYLGKTVNDPFKYKGSGTRWKNHIKKHGYDVTTEILLETTDPREIKEMGIYYSKLWNIVESDLWANLKAEEGDGGDMGPEGRLKHSEKMTGRISPIKGKQTQTNESKKKIGLATKLRMNNMDPDKKAKMYRKAADPKNWTDTRIENMKIGMTGKKKTRTLALLSAFDARRERSTQNLLKAAEYNRGRTWKLIDGKRVWMDKEN